jgi:hypothetical protein
MGKSGIKKEKNKKTKVARNKKKTKRSLKDTLNPLKIPRVRREFIDADYLNKLSETELEWYSKFIDEYVGANIKKSKKVNRVLTRHLHRTNEQAKQIFDMNNRRNNDVYGVTKINGLLSDIDTVKGYGEIGRLHNPDLVEDALIAMIDNQDSLPPEDSE